MYLVRMLLGIATETVQSLPPSIGLKMAEGLKDVLSCRSCGPLWAVFRFWLNS